MRKDMIFCIMGMAISTIGFGLSLRFDFFFLLVVFAMCFVVFLVWLVRIEKVREAEDWKQKREFSKALNKTEKEFKKIYKALSLKADKYPPEKIQAGSRPSEAYERMVKERDNRRENQADKAI